MDAGFNPEPDTVASPPGDGLPLVLRPADQLRRTRVELLAPPDLATVMFEQMPVALALLDENHCACKSNALFTGLLNLTVELLESTPLPNLVAGPWNLDGLERQLMSIWDGSQPHFELHHPVPGSEGQRLVITARPVEHGTGKYLLVSVQDVTWRQDAEELLQQERERLEKKVQITQRALERSREELRALAQSLFTAQEEERCRVARELHDDLSQKLALLEVDTEQLRQSLPSSTERVDEQLADLRNKVGNLSNDVRRIAQQLHPSILDDLGLPIALKALAEEFGRRELMPVRFASRNLPADIRPNVAACLYRITQEALRNVAKHAGKTEVQITLKGSAQSLRLQIRDHGDGFEPAAVRERRGLGILSMQERARLVQGSFRLQARPGGGVCISVRVPVTDAPEILD